jgi:thiamine biosynthesis lipoprotein
MKMRKILLYLLAFGTIASCLALSFCRKQPKKYTSHSFDYFDTVTSVTGYARSEEEFNAVCADIFAMLAEYHRLYTVYERYEGMENLCTVNELTNGSHRTVQVDERIIDLLLYAKEMHEKTRGNVNIAMGSVLSVWHEYREKGLDDPKNAALPPMDTLEQAALHTDIDLVEIDRENGTVTLPDPAMRLDVGAIAKGYAVEMIAQALEANGTGSYLHNVGGNVRTVGSKPDGSPWLIGIENPDEYADDPYAEYISLAGESVVTSGSYQRYYFVDGKNYHHIIDPETLMPAEGYLSVSVICKSSAEGDALSTALFCMSLEEGLALIDSIEGAEAMWILSDGEKHYSKGFDTYIK